MKAIVGVESIINPMSEDNNNIVVSLRIKRFI